jgi:PAS domain-containing protein
LSKPAGNRRRIISAIMGCLLLALLAVAYGRVMTALRADLQDSSRAAVQEAALEVVRPVIFSLVSYGVPEAEQVWGQQAVRPLTAETVANAFERESLALASSAGGTVHSSWQLREGRAFIEFAIADGRGGVATTEVEVRGGLAAAEARFQRFYDVAAKAGLAGSALLGLALLALLVFRIAAPVHHAPVHPARPVQTPAHAGLAQEPVPTAALEAGASAALVRAARAGAEGHWELDYGSARFWRSGAFEALLGREPHDAIETVDEFERMPHPDDIERVRLVFEQHVEIGAPFEVELRLQCANGEWRWFRYCGAGEFVGGTMVRFSGSVSDIERERTARAELERLRGLTPDSRRASLAG